MLRFPRSRRVGVIATIAVIALAVASAFCYDLIARHDAEMLQARRELQRLHELSKIENQQQLFWRERGVERSDLVGVSDTIAYDRAFVKVQQRAKWWSKTLSQLDPQLAASFERFEQAAAEATEKRCLEFLPMMDSELAGAGRTGPAAEAIQKRWMRACRQRCTEDVERLASELIPSAGVAVTSAVTSISRAPSPQHP